jgi:hypothetical protein
MEEKKPLSLVQLFLFSSGLKWFRNFDLYRIYYSSIHFNTRGFRVTEQPLKYCQMVRLSNYVTIYGLASLFAWVVGKKN